MLSDLINLDEPVSDILEFFESQEDILFAVVLQNMLHPNNSNRTEAIKNKKYIEINSLQTAREFIEEIVRFNLTNQLRRAQDEVKQAWEKIESVSEFRLIIEAPDVYVAAVALSQRQFFNGRGHRTTFFDAILNLDPRQIPDLGNKLMLVTQKEFMGLKLYNDECPGRVSKNILFKLWLHCCRKAKVVTLKQMIAFAPYQETYLRNQDRFVDENGRTTLNMEEYKKLRYTIATQKSLQQKKAAAEKTYKKLIDGSGASDSRGRLAQRRGGPKVGRGLSSSKRARHK